MLKNKFHKLLIVRWRILIRVDKNKLLDISYRIPFRFKHGFSISLLNLLSTIKISIQQDLWINMLQFLIYQLVREWQPSGSNSYQIPMLTLRKWSLCIKVNKLCHCADRLILGNCGWWFTFAHHHYQYLNWRKYWHNNYYNDCQIRKCFWFGCSDFYNVCVTYNNLIILILII